MVAAFEFESGQHLPPCIDLALIAAVFHLDGAGGTHVGAGPTADTIRRQAFEVGRHLTFGAAIDETEGMRTDLIAAPCSPRLGTDRAVNLLGVTKSALFVIKPAFSRSLVCYATDALHDRNECWEDV